VIEVIGFDLDDTLWAVTPVIIRAEQTLNAWLAEAAPDLRYDVVSMRELRHDVLQRQPSLVRKITELRRQIIVQALINSDVTQADEIADQAIEVFLAARNQIEFFDGALEVLGKLETTHRLGALSNGNADIHRIGLSHLFDFAFSAEDVGAPKPDPALFKKALSHTGVDPHRMVYVGDDPLLDVDAANQVGLKTIWLDHGNKPIGISQPDITIFNIRELPGAIDTLSRH
jgi:HAD superfamily hydrolase (TIGR01549 family)